MTPCIDHGRKGNAQGYAVSGSHPSGVSLMHRRVFLLRHGYLPEAVMHTCDNPRCINGDHLVGGTRDDNNKDRAKKGRSAKVRTDLRQVTQEQAEEIRRLDIPRYSKEAGVCAVARRYGVDPNVIYNIRKGRTHVASR